MYIEFNFYHYYHKKLMVYNKMLIQIKEVDYYYNTLMN